MLIARVVATITTTIATYTLSLHDALPISATGGDSTLTVANGFTNNGTIELGQGDGEARFWTSRDSETTGMHVNAARVTNTAVGVMRSRELNADLDNRGTLPIDGPSISLTN